MPIEMEDGGRYSRNNHMTFLISKMAEKTLTQAVDASMSKMKNLSQFTYCDFGAADGGMASVLAKSVVDRVRAVDKATTMNIVFVDRPTNDFSSLFSKFQHQITDSTSTDKVFVSVVGRSFYEQCLPEESVDLAWSSASAHWLNIDEDTDPDILEKVKNAYWLVNRSHSHNGLFADRSYEVAMKACSSKAAQDWERFLLMRAKELKIGGRCVVVNSGRGSFDGTGHFDKTFQRFGKVVGHDFVDSLKELVQEGVLTEEEGKSINCPAYGRTVEEHEAPFVDADSPVRRAGLKLTHIETVCIPCSNEQRYLKGEMTRIDYAKKTAASVRTWSYALVSKGLSKSRSEDEKKRLVDLVYERFAKRLADGTSPPSLPYPLVLSVIEKYPPTSMSSQML